MRIGVPKEIKPHEYRVGLTPAGVRELNSLSHELYIEAGAGAAIGLTDDDYAAAGARIVSAPVEVFEHADLIVKVKEPQAAECSMLRPRHLLFTYLHLAADSRQAEALRASGATCVAYETVTGPQGGLPLLAPMSEVAGRLSVQAAAWCLEKSRGGSGVLLGGVPGVPASEVLVIGGGVVGLNAARMAIGLGARVTVFDKSLPRLRQIDELFNGRIATVFATRQTLEQRLPSVDVIVGAALVPGATAPKLLSKEDLAAMRTGSVLVDVAIDQGGCFATSRPTTHADPAYTVDGIVHYCVTNMPGAVARTATFALTNATLPYITALAEQGHQALLEYPGLASGVNVARGQIAHRAVADSLGLDYVDPRTLLESF